MKGYAHEWLIDDSRCDAQDWRQEFCYRPPAFTLVVRSIELAASRAEVEAHRIEPVRRKRIAKHGEKTVPIGKPLAAPVPSPPRPPPTPYPPPSPRHHLA